MAEKNSGKKIYINYSNKEWVEKALADEAEIKGTSVSSIIVDAVADHFISNDNAKMFADTMYKYGLNKSIITFYGQLAGGVNNKSTDEYAILIVRLSNKIVSQAKVDIGSEWDYIANCIESLDRRITYIANSVDEETYVKDNIDFAVANMELIKSQTQESYNPAIIVETIFTIWEYVKNWTITYRLLAAIHRTLTIDETPKLRLLYLELMEETTFDW